MVPDAGHGLRGGDAALRHHLALLLWVLCFQAEDGIRDYKVTGVQTCALPISPRNLEVGATIVSGSEAPICVGNTLPIRNIPVGSTIHCIELKIGAGAQIARSAGT